LDIGDRTGWGPGGRRENGHAVIVPLVKPVTVAARGDAERESAAEGGAIWLWRAGS